MPDFVRVDCPCGRTLRAREDQAGEMIRCWSCHREVKVPRPARGEELARESGLIMRDAVTGEMVLVLMAGAAAATLVLLIPHVGGWIAFGILVVGASRYIDLIRASGLHARADKPTANRAEMARRWALAVVAAAALVAPVVARNEGHARPPDPTSLLADGLVALALALWVVVPLALVAFEGHDRQGRLGPRRALAALAHHPLATFGALAVLPLAVAFVEAYIGLFAWYTSWMPLMVGDLSPPRSSWPGLAASTSSSATARTSSTRISSRTWT
jgi:hypothetical protein